MPASLKDTQVCNRTIFTSDNLPVLRGMNAGSVDLIYLDPPFNSNRNYAAPVGSKAAGAAFKDAWTLQDVDIAWVKQIKTHYPKVAGIVEAAGAVGGKGDQSYLIYMAVRLLELHRVLKDTGSLYLHCDPTMSHSLKLLLDAIFGKRNFRNEIVWCYGAGYPPKNDFARKHDIIFRYGGGEKKLVFNTDDSNVRVPFSTTALNMHFKNKDKDGRAYRKYASGKISYADEGKVVSDYWIDIDGQKSRSPISKEYLGYPTQKPLDLLLRIIAASSNEGDVVLDPFCGCATTCVAAEKLQRQWIGIDISEKAVELVKSRFRSELAIGSEDNPTLLPGVIHRTDMPVRSDMAKRSKNIKELLYGKQKGYCNGCGSHFEMRNFHIDHIVPTKKGGPDVDENLQLLCGHCNSVKGARDMEYLMARLESQK